MEQELCPICIEKPAEYFTECNHSFCIECLCKVKKCAMCRKYLLRSELCIEIKQNVELIDSYINNEELNRRNSDLRSRNRINLMSTLYRIHNPNPTTTFISNLIDSVHYNNNDSIPSRIPRWGDDNMWQQTINIYPQTRHPQNRIPRWGD